MNNAHAHAAATHTCQICGQAFRAADVMPCGMVRGPLHEFLHSKAPNWTGEGYVCMPDLNRLRHEYIEMNMATESQELTKLPTAGDGQHRGKRNTGEKT